MDTQFTLQRAMRGDPQAFEELVTPLEKMVWSVAYRILGSREDAEDAAQDAMIRAYRSIRSYREEASFKTWMYRIAVTAALDLRRKKSTRQAESLDALHEIGTLDPKDPNPGPEEAVLRHSRQEEIRQALAMLPEEQRIPLMLFSMEGWDYEAIASHLSVPIGTVKSRISRARRAMAQNLHSNTEDREPDSISRVQAYERRAQK